MLRLTERTRRVRLLLVVLLLASLALVTIDFRTDGDGPLTKVGNAVSSVLGPLQDGIARIARPVGNFFAGFGQVGGLKAEIRRLQERLVLLEQDQGRVGAILKENETLRELLGIRERFALQTRAAEVIARPPSNFEQSLVLDLGSRDGIRKDMAVIAGAGLVGRIVDVSSSTSKVLLISDPTSHVAVRLATSAEVGTLDGKGRGDLELRLLNPNAIVTAGEHVVTSGQSSVFPPRIPVGTIRRVEAPGGNVTRLAYVDPAVDFTSLDFVLIVVDPKAADRPDPAATATPQPTASATPHRQAASPSPGASR